MSVFNIGDVVTHKSVMFPMVVVKINDNDVECEWLNIDFMTGRNHTNHPIPVTGWVFRDFTLKKVFEQEMGW